MRSDLPGELACRMYWWVSAALRKSLLTEFQIDTMQLEQAVKRAASTAIVERDNEQSSYVRAQKLCRRMNENGELTVPFLINSLRQQRVPVFVAGLAEMGSVDFKTAWRIFSDRGGESLAVLARAIGIDRSQFTSMYLLISQARESGAKSPGVLQAILELFDAVTEQNARGALQVWQRDSAYQNAIEELDKAV